MTEKSFQFDTISNQQPYSSREVTKLQKLDKKTFQKKKVNLNQIFINLTDIIGVL